MAVLVLLALGLVACVVIGIAAAMHAMAQVSELREKLARHGDRLEEIERQVTWLRRTSAGRVPDPSSAPPTDREWAEQIARVRAAASTRDESQAAVRPDASRAESPTPRAVSPLSSWFDNFDWEDLVGVKLFSWIAGIALTLAAVFFLRYSIQNGWLQPPVQMAIGLFVGIGLLAGCEMKVAGNYRVTANAMDAAGIAILFATFFAAFAMWHLVGSAPALAGLALVTGMAVVLSVRRDSLFIAGLGLIGGFLTPALLSTGQDNPLGLFGYLFVLNVGLAWVAYRKRWPWLTSASVALTTIYQWGWVYSFMHPDRVPLGASIFVAFPVLNAAFLVLGRTLPDDADGRVFSRTTDASAVLPLLFAMYLVATPGYTEHVAFVFGFLLCLCAGLFALALARRQELLHLVGGASAFVVMNVHLATSYQSGAWPGIVFWIALFVAFYLAGEWIASAVQRPLGELGGWATRTAPLLLLAFAPLAALEPATREPWLLFGTVFALASVVAVAEFRFSRRWLRMAAAGSIAVVLFTWLAVHQRPLLSIALAGAWAVIAFAWTSAGRGPGAGRREHVDASTFVAVLTAELVTAFAGLFWWADISMLTAGHVVFLSALLWMATALGWYRSVPALVAPAGLAILLWIGNYPPPLRWQHQLMLAAGIYAVFFAYPLVVERRARNADEPWLAAVLASGVFFLAARASLDSGGFESVIGVLPLAQAVLMAVLLWRLLRLEPAGARRLGRLAMVAGALLAFITVAVPLQLEKQWITIGWALEAAALAWLHRRIPHRGLVVACLVLLAAAFGRLTVNLALPGDLERGPRFFNWYLYTYLLSACSMFAAGRFLDATDDVPVRDVPDVPHGATLAKAGGIVLLFALVNIEIADFYSVGSHLSFHLSATLEQDLTYTLAWLAFGVALLVAGIAARSHAARIAALALLVATVVKGFLHDLARLGGLYRVFSFVGLAVCLALVAVVLQKFVLRRPTEAGRPAP